MSVRQVRTVMDPSFQSYGPKEGVVVLKAHATEERQPVHLIFLIDVSDSMIEDGKLESVKQSLSYILPLLTQTDLVSMITFGQVSEIRLNKTPASETDRLLYEIRSLRTNGSTNLSAGFSNIPECLLSTPSHKQGVLLLTDGHANRGIRNPDDLRRLVESLLVNSFSLTTIGYGSEHNASLLRDMAVLGGGSYNIVHTLEDVATVFGDVLGGLTTVLLQNVTIHLPPGVRANTGYSTVQNSDGSTDVRVGDVYAENEIIVLLEWDEAPEAICVRGYDMRTFTPYTSSPPLTQTTLSNRIQQAMLRYRVSRLLNQGVQYDRNEAQRLLDELQALPTEPLIQMMIDDVEGLSRHWNPSVSAQHSAYLSLGRGLRSNVHEDPSASIQSPFMNTSQLRATQSMRMSLSQNPC